MGIQRAYLDDYKQGKLIANTSTQGSKWVCKWDVVQSDTNKPN